MASDHHIPEELLPEILKRLPVKTLFRFQSVHKSWSSLISSPFFTKTHQTFNSTIKPTTYFQWRRDLSHCIIYRHYPTVTMILVKKRLPFPLPIPRDNLGVKILGVIHGIISFVYSNRAVPTSIVFWNPVINRYVSTRVPREGYYRLIGAGYDASTNDFKAVWVPPYNGEASCRYYNVFSARTHEWKKRQWILPESHCSSLIIDNYRGCFFNGAIYWITYSNPRIPENRREGIKNTSFEVGGARGRPHGLAYFSCESEQFGEMELPEQVWDAFGMPIVLVCDGLLSVMAREPVVTGHGMEETLISSVMWTMKEYGVWTKGMAVMSSDVIGPNPYVFKESMFLIDVGKPCQSL